MCLAVSWSLYHSPYQSVPLSFGFGSQITGNNGWGINVHQIMPLVLIWSLKNFRLVGLPHHIGDLQLLKELHVRNNCLKCFPASIQQLQLYTFTGIHSYLTLCPSC